MTNALSKVSGLPYFNDLVGNPLNVGQVFIGLPNVDPRQYPMQVFWDEAQTLPAAQPLSVVNGRLMRAGSVAEVFVNPPYSIYVQDQRGAQVYNLPSVDDPVVSAVGNLTAAIVNNIAALRAVDTSKFSTFNVTSYWSANGVPDGGGGVYKYDPTDTTSVDNGGTVIVTTSGNTIGARLKLQWFNSVSWQQFGMKNDGATDGSAFAAAAFAWVASGATRNKLTAPSGIYTCATWPNWAIQNATIEAQGEVRLRTTGTGAIISADAGGLTTNNVYNLNILGNFIVETPATGSHGVFIRGCHHSVVEVKPRSAGAGKNGIEVEFAVCTTFRVTCTSNEDGSFYANSTPANGLHLTVRNAGEQTSYCLVERPIMENLNLAGGAGILLEGTIGNEITSGTAEGCTYGLLTGTTSSWNKINSIDFESNTTADVYEQGTGNEYRAVDTGTLVTVAGVALWPKFFGGNHQQITTGAGARFPLFHGCNFARTAGGGFTNGEPTTILRDNLNLQTQKIGPLSQGAIAVPASGTPYTNNTGNAQLVSIFSGTITGVSVTRNGTNQGLAATTTSVTLMPGDAVTLTYSAPPTSVYQWQL